LVSGDFNKRQQTPTNAYKCLQMHDFSEVGSKLVIGLFLKMRDFSEVELKPKYYIFYKYLVVKY